MKDRSLRQSAIAILAMVVLLLGLIVPAVAQRGSFGRSGSFGGSTRSSGSFGRSSGSFGGSSSSGSFGRSSGSFGRSSGSSGWFGGSSGRSSASPSTRSRSGSGSFGRSGDFSNSGRINSTSLGSGFNPPPSYQSIPYSTRTTAYYGGSQVPAFGYGFLGGYSLGMLTSPWSHWMPFHPAFYVDPPYYYHGAYYAGGFSFFRFLLGVAVIWLIFRFVKRLFGGRGSNGGSGGGFGGRRRIKYTVYK